MITKITQQIYVGNANDAKDIVHLKELGINAILNVAMDCDDPQYHPNDFLQCKVGLMDNSENKDYMKSLAIVALDTFVKEGKTVLVHCIAGASRSPYICFRWLSENEHRTIESVYAEFLPTIEGAFISPLNYNV